jgi:predicted ABC-type ATPase
LTAAPWFILVAGINGAGKSTFAQNEDTLLELINKADVGGIDIINPDTVTRQIQAENPNIELAEANVRAANACESDVRDRIETRRGNFVIETVLASDKYKEIVGRALELNWNVMLVYVAVSSVEESVRRVAHRVKNGGHDVPEAKIRKRWDITLANLEWFWEKVQVCFLFFNPPDFGEPRLLAQKQEGHTLISLKKEKVPALASVLRAVGSECGVQM